MYSDKQKYQESPLIKWAMPVYDLKGERIIMKRTLALMLCVSLVACLTACGKDKSESEPVETTPSIKVYNEQFTTPATTEPVTEEAEEDEHAPLVPVIEQNLSDEIDLSLVAVNGYEIDLDDLNYQSFLTMSQLQKDSVAVTLLDTSLFYFNSGMYCLNQESSTHLSVELVDKDGNLVPNGEEENYDAKDLFVKGLHCSEFWMKEDYNVSFYAGIKSGMDKDLFIAVMGAGEEIDGKRVYRNSTYTMIVEMEAAFTEENDTKFVVDDITLLRN